MRNTKPTPKRTVFVVVPFARKPKYSTYGRSANLPPLSSPMSVPPPAPKANALFAWRTPPRRNYANGVNLPQWR